MIRRALLLAALLTLAAPSAALANRGQASVMQDDAQFLNTATQTRALNQAKALGVNYIRTLVIWRAVAPASKPANQANPAAYDWSAYDRLVAGARARGIKVLMTLTAPAPAYATANHKAGVFKPSTAGYGAFARAAGTHFKSTVNTWSLMNEPNLNGWLAPQGAYAAVKYRALYRAGHAGLVASGNGKDRILMGELAPTKTKRTTAPVTFYRDVFCLSSRGHKLTGKAAKKLACAKFKKLAASGIAHHPYTNAAACTPRCKGGPTDITIASLSRLAKVLDQASRARRLSSTARTHIWLTEFGFQSNPPNPGPISLKEQAAFINWSEWKGFTSGRVRSYGQYELVDPGAATFNTGLYLQTLKAKPSLTAYRTPLFVVKSGRSVKVFGGARPGGKHRIAIQAKTKSGKFKTVKTVTSNGSGYVYARLGARKTWRLTWVSGATRFYSRVAGVVK